MILVTIEKIDANTYERETLYVVEIFNDGTHSDGSGESRVGSYNAELFDGKGDSMATGRVAYHLRHPRNALLRLVEKAIGAVRR